MSHTPTWSTAIAVYIAYNAIIFATWGTVGANYMNLIGEHVAFKSLVLPLAFGAVFAAAVVTYLGWWRPSLFEPRLAKPQWAWLVLAIMLGFVAVNFLAIKWEALSAAHIAMLVTAGVLVGFNEELVTRGVLVTGLRGSTSNEIWVCFWASLLFGLMHVPNALFGLPLVGGLVQCVFATLMGGAFYVLRRLSGTILLPMAMHGAWDFVSFTRQASGAPSDLSPYFQFGTYLFATVSVAGVLVYSVASGDFRRISDDLKTRR